jgi:MFS family permease
MKCLPASVNRHSKVFYPPYKDKNLHIIISLILTALIGVVTVNPVLPTLANALHIPSEQIGLVIAAFVIPVTIGVPIFGILADRIGRKKVIIPSLLVFAIAGILCSTAQDFRALLEWRFLQGVGSASLELLALTLIGDLYKGERVIPAMAFLASTIGVSTTVFPLLGGALAELNWRLVFLLPLVAVPLALLVLTTLKLPPQPEVTEKFSLKDYAKETWSSINNVQVLGLLLAVVCVFMLQFGPCFIYIPVFAGTVLHARGEIIGVLLAGMQVFLAIFASQLGVLSRKLSEATMIKIAFGLFAIAFLMVPLITNIWILLIPCFLLGAAEALSLPPIRALLTRISPDQTRAGFMAANAVSQSLGQALGPILTGIAFKVWGMQGVFYACAGFALVIVAMLQFFLSPKRFAASMKPEETY